MEIEYKWGLTKDKVLVELPSSEFIAHKFLGSKPSQGLIDSIHSIYFTKPRDKFDVGLKMAKKIAERNKHKNDSLRPTHYTKGSDTFTWAEERFNTYELRAIAEFNIHKYTNRLKGEDVKDFGKIADYALWIKGILVKELEDE